MLAMAIDQAGSPDPHPWWWIVLADRCVLRVPGAGRLPAHAEDPGQERRALDAGDPLRGARAGALAGVYGVLIAIPIAACIKIIITDVIFPRYRDWVEGRAKDPLPLGDEPTG